jgi:hypothetical protein
LVTLESLPISEAISLCIISPPTCRYVRMYVDHIGISKIVVPVKYQTTRQENRLINFLHNYVINTTKLIHNTLSLSLCWGSKSRHVSDITCLSSRDTTRMQLWWLLCAVVDVDWSKPTSTTAHTSHQSCIRVVSPDDRKVMPETCRDFGPQQNDNESELCMRLVVFIT